MIGCEGHDFLLLILGNVVGNSVIRLPCPLTHVLVYSSLHNLYNHILKVSLASFTRSHNVSLHCSKPRPRPPCPHLELASSYISASHASFVPASRHFIFHRSRTKFSEMVLNIEINASRDASQECSSLL